MRRPCREDARAAAAAALALVTLALALASCGGYCLPAPPTALPPWPVDASPQPALTYPAQSATTEHIRDGAGGWFFMPVVDIRVTALGYYDDAGDGLLHAHRSAIFDGATRQRVAETIVRPGSPLKGLFRWEPVGPVVLKAGHEYVIVSSSEQPYDPQVLNPEDACIAPELRYLRYRETRELDSMWGYPDRSAVSVILAGNFRFRPVSVASP
jgi:hypothetical protein